MKKQKKRYLITYADGSVGVEKAVSILGISKNKCRRGVAFMESGTVPSGNDVLHFENLGVSTIELSDDEAGALSKKEGVLAVEEDIEMFALASRKSDEAQFRELFMKADTLPESPETNEESYLKGYKEALSDMFSSILDMTSKKGLDNDFLWALLPDSPSPPAPVFQPVPWNISLIQAPEAWARGVNGNGVKVAVLDTGIASHPDLEIAGGTSFIPGSTGYDDLNGHGTHCAGVVAAKHNSIGVVGVAPEASLYAVKVLGDNGSGNTSWIIAGMEWCVINGIKVASMSLGGSSDPLVAYANAVKRCQDNGVTVVIASGNSYGTSFPWVCAPANSFLSEQPNASPIAAGAIDNRNVIAGFSSRGGRTANWNQVTCVAPGVSINSTHLGNDYATMSGTSMACPHIAGLAALVIQCFPDLTPANVKRRIATTCTDLGATGLDTTYGYGLINCDAATR